MRRKIERIFIPATVVLLFIAVSWFQGCNKPVEKEAAPGEFKMLTDADYVGTETCQSCHQKEYLDWHNSDHDLAMMEADVFSVKGDFNTTFVSQGVTSRFYRKDNKFFVHTEGPDGKYHDYEVIYTYGIEPLQQYIVEFPDGKLQCLRTAWDTEKGQWFDLYPDYEVEPDEWLHWSRGGLNWNTMCSDCHSTNVHKNFDEKTNSFNTTFTIIDVSCESCHGPGKEHVELVSHPDFDSSRYDVTKDNLFLTSSLTPHEQVDQCARCHSRRVQYTEAFNHEGEYMDHYAPEILRDHLYFPDGQILDEVYVYGSFIQSKMYANNVKCSDCHNPHSLELKAVGNALCGQCHVKSKYDTPDHHFHTVDTEGAQCINCHMTGRYYMGNDFRNDHSFRVPRPDLSVEYNTPNACNQCHTDKTAQWAADAVVKWYGPERAFHFGETLAKGSRRTPEAIPHLISLTADTSQPAIARATAIWYLDQIVTPESVEAIIKNLNSKDHIVRHTAVNALIDLPADQKARHIAPLLNDKIRTVRLAAANAMADVPKAQLRPQFQADFEKALQEYQKSLPVRADFPGGQFEKGQFFDRMGEDHQAEQAYLKAIELDNRLNAARLNLAHLYNRQGKNDQAIALFETIIEQEPGYGMAYYSLGLLYAEVKNMEKAIEYLASAARMEDNPRIYYNLGVAYQQTNQPDKAEDSYLKGLKLDKNDYNLMHALSILYIQQEKFRKARPYLEKLLEAFPDNQQIRQLMEMANQ